MSALVVEGTRHVKSQSVKPIRCPECGEAPKPDLDVTGELLEYVCKTRNCPEAGLVFARRPLRAEHVERFGRSPTNPGMFGKKLGSIVPKSIERRIIQQDHAIKREGGRIIQLTNTPFPMHTRKGRTELTKANRQFAAITSNMDDEPREIHYALELLSQHNRKVMNLPDERYAMLCEHMRAIIKQTMAEHGPLTPTVIREGMSQILVNILGLPGLPENRRST